ncbi:MAG: hypothetical protein IH612_07090, partial [Desulfofustis sp.]|nr:hypothetical protein [Desulfofustis sp.]
GYAKQFQFLVAERQGKNTNYIIHPEDILADNFALLILYENRFSRLEGSPSDGYVAV